MKEKIEIRNSITCKDGSISSSNLHGAHIAVSTAQSTTVINFSSRKQITDLCHSLMLVADDCFPVEYPTIGEDEVAAMAREGGLHEKEEFEL